MKPSPTYLIAEDEPILAQMLQRLLAEQWPEAACRGIATSGHEALEYWAQHRPDVVFMDVQMPGKDGLSAARELSAEDSPPLIVFVTAYDAYAVAAFDAQAIDYLLKPVDTERLGRCIKRLREALESGSTQPNQLAEKIAQLLSGSPAATAPLKFLRAGLGNTVKLIPIEEVIWFEAKDKYVMVGTKDGESIIRLPLKELLPQLDTSIFWQIHRGSVVNSRYVISATRDELGRISVKLRGRADEIAVSRQFAHLFRQM